MNRLLRHIAISTLLAACILLTACGDDSCYDNGSSLPLAEFYMGTSKQTISLITVMGIGAPGDSLLADGSNINELYLPLRASVTTTSFEISRPIDDDITVTDTLTIHYQPIAFFHSKECGAMYNFDISSTNYTHNGIDSVVILNTLVTNALTPSMRIYFTDFSDFDL